MGGNTGAVSNVTEEYDGTSWSSGGNLTTARYILGAGGTIAAGLCFAGYGAAALDTTEEYSAGSGSYDEMFTPSQGL